MTVEIEMGGTSQGAAAAIDLEELLATRLLVQGNSGSGKSHLLRRLIEQSARWVQQCVVDPEGDFVTLAERFGHVVIEADRPEAELTRLAGRVRRHRVSAVLDLEGLEAEAQMRAAAAFLGGLFDAERDHWYPMLVVVDEAQLFAPAAGGEVSDEARKLSLGAMTNLMCRGRKRGLAGVIATQRLAKLAKNVAAEASNFLMGRTFLDIDMARAADLLGMDRRGAERFRDLDRGRFVGLGPAIARRPVEIGIGPVETAPRSTSPKLMPLPEAARDAAALIFSPPSPGEAPPPPPRRAAPAPRPAADILTQLSAARPASAERAEEAEADKEEVAAVLSELASDPDTAFRPVAVLYQDFLVRCRIRRVAGTPPALSSFRRLLAVAKAGVDAATRESAGWAEALRLSESLAEDVQGVFLLMARAALEGAPCPSDATLARAYGSHSAARARRLLLHFEERNLILLREASGGRVAVFPELGAETAPGDAGAPAEAGPLAGPIAAE